MLASTGPSSTSVPMPVLILDDERFDRHRLARLCSGLIFPIAISNAKSLLEFSDLLETETFGLILIDYVLPDGSGLDALALVQLSPRNLNTATLLISGQVEPAVAQQAREIGCAGYLSKDDLTKDSFAKVVSKAIAVGQQVVLEPGADFTTATVEHLLSRCSARSARDVKPMVSRLLRQIRHLRTSPLDHPAEGLGAIEQNCMSLWAFLIEMEREDGAKLLSDLQERQFKNVLPPFSAKQERPPSPFAPRRH